MDTKPPPPDTPAADAGRPAGNDAAPPGKPRLLPYASLWPLLAGALFGIAMRLVYSGAPGGVYTAMDGAFIYLVPVAVGAVTVYLGEQRAPRSWGYWAWAPMVANALFVAGTMAMLIEGLICAVIILPLFCAFGAVGGLLMGLVCRHTRRRRQAMYSVAALPLLLGGWPTDEAALQRIGVVERTIVVEAPAQAVWRELLDARDIRPEEVQRAWMYRIGVPLPISGVTRRTEAGLVRDVSMGRSIHFHQVSTDWQEQRRVRWTYRFDADSFPAGALDDHVVIGGHYFDLLDTTYELAPDAGGATRLRIVMRYRVGTQFNWYADGVARFLIGNFEDVILAFYRRRAMNAG